MKMWNFIEHLLKKQNLCETNIDNALTNQHHFCTIIIWTKMIKKGFNINFYNICLVNLWDIKGSFSKLLFGSRKNSFQRQPLTMWVNIVVLFQPTNYAKLCRKKLLLNPNLKINDTILRLLEQRYINISVFGDEVMQTAPILSRGKIFLNVSYRPSICSDTSTTFLCCSMTLILILTNCVNTTDLSINTLRNLTSFLSKSC